MTKRHFSYAEIGGEVSAGGWGPATQYESVGAAVEDNGFPEPGTRCILASIHELIRADIERHALDETHTLFVSLLGRDCQLWMPAVRRHKWTRPMKVRRYRDGDMGLTFKKEIFRRVERPVVIECTQTETVVCGDGFAARFPVKRKA